MQSSVIPASATVRLSLPRKESTAIQLRKNGDPIGPTKASRGTNIPFILRLREVRPKKAVLSDRPHAFRAASGLKSDPWLNSSTLQHSLTLSIPHCDQITSVKSRKVIKTHFHHPPWIQTPSRATLTRPSVVQLPSFHLLSRTHSTVSISRRPPTVSL